MVVAGALAEESLVAGDRFALSSPNHPVHMSGQLAACRSATTLVPLNTRLSAAELVYIVVDSGVRVMLVHEELAKLGFKIPESWSFIKILPRNATGKVLKSDLRARWQERNDHTNKENP